MHEILYPLDVIPELPLGEPVQIRTHISLPDSSEWATLKVTIEPFRNDGYPGQWFHGRHINLDICSSQHCHFDEILAIARRRAEVINTWFLQTVYCDCSQSDMQVLSPPCP